MGRLKLSDGLKSPFKLRRRTLKDGRQSLFIDHFHEGKHRYRFLRLYLLPCTDEVSRRENTRTLRRAKDIVEKLTADFIASQTTACKKAKKDALLLSEFIDWLIEDYKHKDKKGFRHFITLRQNLEKFRPGTRLADIGTDFCREYACWLKESCCSARHSKPLSPTTVHVYFVKFGTIMFHAHKAGYIPRNPWKQLLSSDKIKQPGVPQRFLTVAELEMLERTPYKHKAVKEAFLFACYSGLRISDILSLEWDSLRSRESGMVLDMKMQKTGVPLVVPLSSKAIRHLPHPFLKEGKVFDSLPQQSQIQKHLKKWSCRAGLKGRMHFHVARHTFATLLLTAGVDIYSTSKMLGHSDIRATQVYARIIDEKRVEAMKNVDRLMDATNSK